MKNHYITTGTVTYAIKGRDLLRNYGIKANIERKREGLGSAGCGYNIVVYGDLDKALSILKAADVKILEIN